MTIAQLLTWEGAPLDQAAENLYATRRQLMDLQDEVLDSRVPTTWWGDAASAALLDPALVGRLRDMIAEVARVATSLEFAGQEILDARQLLEGALDTARGSGFEVNRTTGEITDTNTYGTWMHRVEVAVLDTEDGRQAVEQVLGAISVHPWERPA